MECMTAQRREEEKEGKWVLSFMWLMLFTRSLRERHVTLRTTQEARQRKMKTKMKKIRRIV
jgi:hypothetical protein